ncbi:hypothetical protein P4T62_28380 [Bacillus mycoides]|nr:hypothetical protein [Bacillus mycoides]
MILDGKRLTVQADIQDALKIVIKNSLTVLELIVVRVRLHVI